MSPADDTKRSSDRESSPKGKGRNRERRPPRGPGLLWYMLVGLAISLLIASFVRAPTSDEIPYSELVRLVKQGAPEQNPDAAIELERTEMKTTLRVRYSNLRDIVIRPTEIVGKVDREILAPEDRKKGVETVSFRTARLGLNNDDNALLNLFLDNGFTNVRGGEPPSFWEEYGPQLLLLGLFVVVLFFLMRRVGGPGSAMAFGRSRGRMYAQEEIGVTFDDVAGVDEAVEEVREIVEFLKKPEKYQALGGRIPKGVLLVGPPGTGKTLLAKAIAGEAGVPFFSLSGSDFVEMFVGVGAARVRDMFQQAQQQAPCIVFIDELDALGKMRAPSVVSGQDEREQTLNALLVEMDGFSSNSGVIVIAATNRPETLDPALLRPGRFDRHILVDRPDIRGREAILKVHAKEVKLDPSVDLAKVAAMTPGFVGADLSNLINEAALLAARNNKEAVGMEELTEAIERVIAGLEKRKRVIGEEEKRRLAYHESGHALLAMCLPNTDPVHKVSIIPRGLQALGYTMQRPEGDRYLWTKAELESNIKVLLAGTVAEEMNCDDISTGAANDLDRATEIARRMVTEFGMSRLGPIVYRRASDTADGFPGFQTPLFSETTAREIDEEIRRIIRTALDDVRTILKKRAATLKAIAERLIEKEVIDQDELREIIDETTPGPTIVPGTEAAEPRSTTTDRQITRDDSEQLDAAEEENADRSETGEASENPPDQDARKLGE